MNLAATILRDDQLAIGGAHAIRTLDRLVHPNIDRLACLACGVHWDAVEIVREHVVHVERAVQEGRAGSF